MIKSVLRKTPVYRWYQEWLIAEDSRKTIERNRHVRGTLIRKFIPPGGIGAELGVLRGEFSCVLLESSAASKLHLIDPWYFIGPDWSWSGGNTSTVDAVMNILKTHKKDINEGKVLVHIQDDLSALAGFPDDYFDWVYIDSSHTYEHTVSELALLHKKVKASGIICGDDWVPDDNHRHHGVFKAVQEFMSREGYELIYAGEEDMQWFIRKKQH